MSAFSDTHRTLIDEAPLIVQPSLARLLGLDAAVFMQQLHYWLRKSEHLIDGRTWVYNTIAQWLDQMPFWSEATFKRMTARLRALGVLLTGKFSTGFDRTTWYAIDYDVLDTLLVAARQTDAVIGSDCAHEEISLSPSRDQSEPIEERALISSSINRDYTETTTEKSAFSRTRVSTNPTVVIVEQYDASATMAPLSEDVSDTPSAGARATPDTPHAVVEGFLAALNTSRTSASPKWLSSQYGFAKRLLEQGFGVDAVVRCTQFMLTQTWRTSPFDLRAVEAFIGTWEANGCHASEDALVTERKRRFPSLRELKNPLLSAILSTDLSHIEDELRHKHDSRNAVQRENGLARGVAAETDTSRGRLGEGDARILPALGSS